jgi:hypothetical protein
MIAGRNTPVPSFCVVDKQPTLVSPTHGGNLNIMRQACVSIPNA